MKTNNKLQANLKMLQQFSANMKAAGKKRVAVGLPKEKVGDQVYGDGVSIVMVGAWHEYGMGNNPTRSFLRMPFAMKQDEIVQEMTRQFAAMFEGSGVEKSLGLIGVRARNISVKAFRTKGYGKWAENDPYTVKQKGSSAPLIDTGTLRNSITWAVR